MSPSRTTEPSFSRITSCWNSFTERRSVLAVRFTWTSEPLVWPMAER